MDVVALRRHVDQRLEGMRNERMSYFNHWRELSDYIQPRRGRFLITPNQGNRGDPRTNKILNNTGTKAARILSSGMLAGLTSPARPWFKLGLGGQPLADASPVKLWLDGVAKAMMRVFAKSNFYNALAQLYDELGIFATAAMLILEDRTDVVRCYTLTVGEYFLANDHRNEVNSLYREFTMTVAQLVGQFGLEACSPTVRSLNDSNQGEKEIIVCQAIEPNDDQMPGGLGVKGASFRSIYWEKGSSQDCMLEIKGFAEFPGCGVRWATAGNDVYGKGPGMDALPDVKTLQFLERRSAQVVDKITSPAMAADSQLSNAGVSQLPGSITYVSNVGSVGVKPIYEPPPAAVTAIDGKINTAERRINEAFYTDLWKWISQMEGVQPRNDLEISERRGEMMLQLGPVLESVQRDLLDRSIDRVFSIMLRHSLPFWARGQDGLLPLPPPQMHGVDFDVQYISVLAQAQKAVATGGIEGLMAFVGRIASVNPGVLDTIDFDECTSEYADMIGVPPKIMRSPEQIADIRASRAKQQQQQQAMQQSMAAVQGAQVLSQTDVGGGQNALQRMIGGGQ